MDDWIPVALGRLDLDALVGLSVQQARSAVEEAGGELRAVPRGWAMGLPYRPGLVTVMIGDDLVTSVLGLQGRVAEDYVPAGLAKLNVDLLVGMGVGDARAQVECACGELHVLTSWNVPFDL